MSLEKDMEKSIKDLKESSNNDIFEHMSYEEHRQLLEVLIKKQIDRLLDREN